LADYFPGMKPEKFFQQLDARGREVGIRFCPQTRMSNSRKALEAGEFAKAQGKFEAYHEAIFHAFFTECKDIGRWEVISDAAESVGLNAEILEGALKKKTYLSRLETVTQLARSNRVTAAPTFVINEKEIIVGAQPIEKFRALLSEIG